MVSRHSPSWLNSRWAKVLGGAFTVALAIALLAPYLLDIDRYRDRISDAISLQTGRKVTLGKLRATVLPRIGFSVEGFQVANPPDFAQGELIRAETMRGALAFWPLVLRHELRVISLDLTEPRLTLLEDAFGHNNYTFSARRPASSASTKRTQTAAASAAPITLMVDQVMMRDAVVFYGAVDRRGRAAGNVRISNLDVEFRQIALQPLHIRQWQADASLGGTQLTLAGWNTPVLFDSGAVTLHDGKLDSSFTVNLGDAARIEGSVTIPNVEDAVPQFDLKTESLDLNALITGAVAPIPRVDSSDRLTPVVSSEAVRPLPPRMALLAAVATPAAVPSRMVAQGHFAAGRVRKGNYTAGPFDASLRIFNDRTEIWPVTLRVAGGIVQITARTDRRQAPQRFSANVQVRELNAEQALQDSPDWKGKFAGTAEMDLQLIGSLQPNWTESLAGNGQLIIRNGRLAGFPLTGTAKSIADLAGLGGGIPFTRLTGDVNLRDGRIASRQIHLDSPRGIVDLKGSCGLYGSLDYQGLLVAKLSGPSSLPIGGAGDVLSVFLGSARASRVASESQITLPFLLRGTLQRPEVRTGGTGPKFTRIQTNSPASATPPQETNGFSFPNLFGH